MNTRTKDTIIIVAVLAGVIAAFAMIFLAQPSLKEAKSLCEAYGEENNCTLVYTSIVNKDPACHFRWDEYGTVIVMLNWNGEPRGPNPVDCSGR